MLPNCFSTVQAVPARLPTSQLLSSILLFRPIERSRAYTLGRYSTIGIVSVRHPTLYYVDGKG